MRLPDHFKTQKRKARAVMTAEFALRQRLKRIEWEENVMLPELEKLSLQASQTMEIPEFIVEDDTPNNN